MLMLLCLSQLDCWVPETFASLMSGTPVSEWPGTRCQLLCRDTSWSTLLQVIIHPHSLWSWGFKHTHTFCLVKWICWHVSSVAVMNLLTLILEMVKISVSVLLSFSNCCAVVFAGTDQTIDFFVGDVSSYTLHNLQPGTTYDVKVIAQYTGGMSAPLTGQGTTRTYSNIVMLGRKAQREH